MGRNYYRIGFIGMGKMAEAILYGILSNDISPANHVYFNEIRTDRTEHIEKQYGIRHADLHTILNCHVVLFCIKPQNILTLLESLSVVDIENRLFLSILAGIPMSLYERYLGVHAQLARVMPNTPGMIGDGMTAISFKSNVCVPFQEFTKNLFSLMGDILVIEESFMDVVTGISGSGPAFLYQLSQAIAQVAISEGMSEKEALYITAQTMVGAGRMLQRSSKTPEQLINDVSSPNGTTVAGLQVYHELNIDSAIQQVVKRAIQRARELSNLK